MSDELNEQREMAAFLHALIEKHGVDGLKERLSHASDEAGNGQIGGPALDEVTAWLETEYGDQVPQASAIGHLSLTATATSAMAAGTAHLELSGALLHWAIVWHG